MICFLVPAGTIVIARGDGPAIEVSAAAYRVFLLTLRITKIVEQEALAQKLESWQMHSNLYSIAFVLGDTAGMKQQTGRPAARMRQQ